MRISIKNIFNKREQIRRKLRIWTHLLKKSLMNNFLGVFKRLRLKVNAERLKLRLKD